MMIRENVNSKIHPFFLIFVSKNVVTNHTERKPSKSMKKNEKNHIILLANYGSKYLLSKSS